MRLNVLTRKIHHWSTVFVAVPVLIIIGSGLLLQLKKQWDWVQPPEQRGSVTQPAIGLEDILDATRSVELLGVGGWPDIDRLDVRPERGLVKVRLHSGWEVQVDLGTGVVLQTAYRRSDLLESIHDGSFFAGDWTKLGLFLPAGIVLLAMWLTGVWMFIIPYTAARRRRRRMARRS